MNTPTPSTTGSYVLAHLDVYDWGAFGGRHSAQIDLEGTAIIGPTGSGKTTLVDALMTLLVANPRYNLASTGGHESDRDLVSYVRGVSGAGNDSDANEHIARPGPVVAAIAARFNNDDAILRIGGMFWFDGTSSAPTDLKRRWLFCQGDTPSLDDWLETHRGGGARALKELERSCPGLKVYDTKQAFLSRLRNHFEVGENAFALLNRAAGLKQLNSIDTVFRELVLDDRSAFDSARAVADEFDTLSGIRQELEIAKKQRESLFPIAAGWSDLQKQRSELGQLVVLKAILPVWFAQEAAKRWRARMSDFDLHIESLKNNETEMAARIDRAVRDGNDAHAVYIAAGGGDIERLRGQIDTQTTLVASRERAAREYRTRADALGMDTTLSVATVQANQQAVATMRPAHEARFQELQKLAWATGSTRSDLEDRHAKAAQALDEVRKRPRSNVPLAQQNFRSDLAAHLGLREEDVPFVAELIEVQADARAWRGAIERAIGGERLRLLVRPDHTESALAWINERDNKLHVRVHEADPAGATAQFFEDGFTRKLNFNTHPLREPLKRLLAGIDRHCVADVAAMRNTPHAMTIEGLMSGRRKFFDKDDQTPLGRGWMTGFDNRDQIAELEMALEQLHQDLVRARKQQQEAEMQAESIRKSLGLLDAVANTVFEDVDLPGAQAQLDYLSGELTRLTSPRSDAALAEQRWKQARDAVAALRDEDVKIKTDIKDLDRQISDAGGKLERLNMRIGAGLDGHSETLAATHFPHTDDMAVDELEDAERRLGAELQTKIDTTNDRCGKIEKRLIADMKDAKQLDTGALVDTGSELQDIQDYVERLRVLEREALPEKLSRFLNYLNQSSDQGVTQLLSEIDSEVSVIEERIADLNTTLERVDFQPGRYLRLDPQRVEHESLRTLRQARAHLRSAQLKDDLGESHYRALADLVGLLRDAVERSKTLGALALLDPRYRLQFAVLVIERDSGKIIEKRTSSHGGSGGEKEIIASYVLTASLSYALCPPGSQRPLFGTIVLDEAFSKSSKAVAGRIIRALAEFGLHPLFVTPNKELRLLREHTRSAIVIHRKGMQATMTSLSWEALEAHARSRAQRQERDVEVT
jgi:uncharacterized protein YPO0396